MYVGIETRLRTGRPRESGFDSRQEQEISPFSVTYTPALGPTRSHIVWGRVAVSPEVKPQGCEAEYTPPSSAEVRNGGATPLVPHTSS
jgi:hypothetical protein